MSREQQDAVIQEFLDQSQIYRANAHLSHGVPGLPPRNVIGQPKPAEPDAVNVTESKTSETTVFVSDHSVAQPQSTPAAAPPPPQQPQVVIVPQQPQIQEQQQKLPQWLWAALAASTVGAGGIGYTLSSARQPASVEPPAVVQTQDRDATMIIEEYTSQSRDGSLLQWLRQKGLNLPAEAPRRGK